MVLSVLVGLVPDRPTGKSRFVLLDEPFLLEGWMYDLWKKVDNIFPVSAVVSDKLATFSLSSLLLHDAVAFPQIRKFAVVLLGRGL